MAAPALSRKALNLLYEIQSEQFSCKEFPFSTNNYSSTYAADILVNEQPEYPDIPSSVWSVVLKLTGGSVTASVRPKELTDTKSSHTVMVSWKIGLGDTVFDGQIDSNVWAPTVTNTSGGFPGLVTQYQMQCGYNCRNTLYHYYLREGLKVSVSLTFVVEKTVRQDLECLLDSHMFSDCTLICEDKKLPAHRAILAAQSPVFAAMFQSEMKEKSTGVCKIDDIRLEVLEALVQYAYGRAPLKTDGTLQELWIAADKYDMKELRNECERTILHAITAENALKYLCFADEHGMLKLRAAAAKCISQQPL